MKEKKLNVIFHTGSGSFREWTISDTLVLVATTFPILSTSGHCLDDLAWFHGSSSLPGIVWDLTGVVPG